MRDYFPSLKQPAIILYPISKEFPDFVAFPSEKNAYSFLVDLHCFDFHCKCSHLQENYQVGDIVEFDFPEKT